MSKVIDRTGLRYGRLLVIDRAGSNAKQRSTWNVVCDCGNKLVVDRDSLNSGKVKSCGCLRQESYYTNHKTHGRSKTTEYNTWMGIKARCNNEQHPCYYNYGGRGIKVCDRWMESFENFIEDVGKKPDAGSSLDRINNNEGYSKKNCRWASAKEQANNMRCNRLVTVDGMTKSASEMADYFGIKLAVVMCRLNRNWPIDEVFKKPLTPINRFITVDGITKTVTEMAALHNIDRRWVTNRLKLGWTPEQAVKTPVRQINVKPI